MVRSTKSLYIHLFFQLHRLRWRMSFQEFNCNKYNIYKRFYLSIKEVAEEIEYELEPYINYFPGIYKVGEREPIPLDRLCILNSNLEPVDLVVPNGSFDDIVKFLTSHPNDIYTIDNGKLHIIISKRHKRFKQFSQHPVLPFIGAEIAYQYIKHVLNNVLMYTKNSAPFTQSIIGLTSIQRVHVANFYNKSLRQEYGASSKDVCISLDESDDISESITREAIRDEMYDSISRIMSPIEKRIEKFVIPYVWHIHYTEQITPFNILIEQSIDYRAKDHSDSI